MHILLIPSYYPHVKHPVGPFFHDQALALKQAGHRVSVLVTPRKEVTALYLRFGGLKELRAVTLEKTDDIPIYRMHWGWFPRIFPRIQAWLIEQAGLRAFEQYINDCGMPDIIHSHNIFYGGYMAVQIRRKWGIPVVLTEHNTNFLRGRIFLPGQHKVVKDTLRGVDGVLAVGSALAQKLKEFVPEVEVGLIGNVVDTDFFSPQTPDLKYTPFIFASVGHLISRKGFDLLIKAFAKEFANQNASLYIGGEGSERIKLEKLAVDLGVAEQVRFLGQLTREKVRDLFQEAHIIVSSSYVETFGVTLIEGMACGKPVIATRSGGPEMFVDNTNGLLIPTGDLNALASAMRFLEQNHTQYNSDIIRAGCVNRFSEDVIARRLESIYQSIIPA